MDEEAAALRQSIARYRRSLLAINDPDIIEKLEEMIKEAQARLDTMCRAQQPGKPKPPGNPQKHPDHDVPPPIEDPPEAVPTPSERDDPAPMDV
jgi:hypothetical protein